MFDFDFNDSNWEPESRLIAHRVNTARRAHKCTLCDKPIAPKTQYERQTWIFDGTLSVSTVHLPCKRIQELAANLACSVFERADLREMRTLIDTCLHS